MNAAIQLTKLVGNPQAAPAERRAYPLTIIASGTDLPDEIFVYQIDPAGDRFSCVATVSQMEEIPRYNGQTLTSETRIPFYRTAQMTVICRNPAEVERVWRIAQEDSQSLVENWNAAWALTGVDQVLIDESAITPETLGMTPPQLIQLDYRPAGTATYVDSVQGIAAPDATRSGWLPVASAPPSWTIPPGAVFYYNLAEDVNLAKYWPLPDPVSGNLLHRNGILLPYGITHVYDKNAIWWLAFNPTNLPGYQRLAGQEADSAALWPVDYVSPQYPGATSPILTLTIFTEVVSG